MQSFSVRFFTSEIFPSARWISISSVNPTGLCFVSVPLKLVFSWLCVLRSKKQLCLLLVVGLKCLTVTGNKTLQILSLSRTNFKTDLLLLLLLLETITLLKINWSLKQLFVLCTSAPSELRTPHSSRGWTAVVRDNRTPAKEGQSCERTQLSWQTLDFRAFSDKNVHQLMSDSTRNNCWRLIVFEAASRYFFKKINFISYVFFRSRVESRSSRPSICFQHSKTSLTGSPKHRKNLDNVDAASPASAADAVADVPSIQRKISESVSEKKKILQHHNNNSLPQQSLPIAETQKDNNYYFLLLRGFVQFYFFLGSRWRDSRFVRWKKEKPFFRRLHHRRRKPREKENIR